MWVQQINCNCSKLLLPPDAKNIFEVTERFTHWYYGDDKRTLGSMLHSKLYGLNGKGLKLEVTKESLKQLNLQELNVLKSDDMYSLLMILFDKLGFNASYGAVLAALIGYSLSIYISFSILRKKYGFKFQASMKRLPKYIVSWVVFIGIIALLKLFIPINLESRLIQIPILCIYGGGSFLGYFYINYRNGNLKEVFGSRLDKYLKKLKLVK